MKFECAKVRKHDMAAAVGFAALCAAAACHLISVGVHDTAASGLARAVAIIFGLSGFVQAALCVFAVPANRVNDVRLAVGAFFASLAWLDGVASVSLSPSERAFHVIGYLTVAVVAAAALVERDVVDELRREAGR